MTFQPSSPRRRTSRTVVKRGQNPGVCVTCNSQSNWRSVSDRCWRCEMEEIKARRPLYVDRDVLASLGTSED